VAEDEFAARMSILPCFWDSQDIVSEDDQCLAVGNKIGNLSPVIYTRIGHDGVFEQAKSITLIPSSVS
jgi:hypothetical protein